MKRIGSIVVAVVLTSVFSFQNAFACSIEIPPLRKQFRKAKTVFVGSVESVAKYTPSTQELLSVPEGWKDWKDFSRIKFKVINAWKGASKKQELEYIAVAHYFCGCPGRPLDEFKPGREYLIVARERKFVPVCESKDAEKDWVKNEIKSLDGFWFRAWATVYPF